MPVFISYSHTDAELVDRLAVAMVQARTHVWVDRWELKVGDSLLDRIQREISVADALVVVLSKASVSSEWCRRELNAGLVRELEEKQILVLPALLEDCAVPLFLKDKLFADFRGDFERGLRQVRAAVAKYTSTDRARSVVDDGITDWALDWGSLFGRRFIQMTFVQHQPTQEHTVFTTVQAFPNDGALRRIEQFAQGGLGWLGNHFAAEFIAGAADEADLRAVVTDRRPVVKEFVVADEEAGIRYDCIVTCRLLGNDPGNDILVNVGALLGAGIKHIAIAARPLTASELQFVDQLRRG